MSARLPGWSRAAAGLAIVGWGANQFAALLPVYRETTGLSASQISLAFAIYIVGLIPALFIAAEVADRIGRRWLVRIAVVLSAAASVVLCFSPQKHWLLLLGRLMSGAAAGAALGPGSAWVTELSDDDRAAAPKRVTVALSVGFGGGPLVAGVVAQWAPWPEASPYSVHFLVSIVAAALLWRTPDPSFDHGAPTEVAEHLGTTERPPDRPDTTPKETFWETVRSAAFIRTIPFTAPWVFGAATMSFAIAPSVIDVRGFSTASAGVITGITMGSGALVQPFAQRIERWKQGAAMPAGLSLAAFGMLLAAAAFAVQISALLLPVAVILGSAYGVILVAGLRQIETLGHSKDRARLNAAYFSFTYIGFIQPFVFAVLATTKTSQIIFAMIGALVATATTVATSRARHV